MYFVSFGIDQLWGINMCHFSDDLQKTMNQILNFLLKQNKKTTRLLIPSPLLSVNHGLIFKMNNICVSQLRRHVQDQKTRRNCFLYAPKYTYVFFWEYVQHFLFLYFAFIHWECSNSWQNWKETSKCDSSQQNMNKNPFSFPRQWDDLHIFSWFS